MWEDTERLLEAPHGLAVCRPRHGLLSRLSAVRQGLVPHLPPQGMMGAAFHLPCPPIPSEGLQDLDNTGMQRAPSLLEQTPVRHLVREGVLEREFALGEQ